MRRIINNGGCQHTMEHRIYHVVTRAKTSLAATRAEFTPTTTHFLKVIINIPVGGQWQGNGKLAVVQRLIMGKDRNSAVT